jgi:glutathione S-transferase
VDGDVAIMLYLDAVYGSIDKSHQADLALRYTQFQRALKLGESWRRHDKSTALGKALRAELEAWDAYAAKVSDGGIATAAVGIADFALWPVLHAIVQQYGAEVFDGMDNLKGYFEKFSERDGTMKVLGKGEASA